MTALCRRYNSSDWLSILWTMHRRCARLGPAPSPISQQKALTNAFRSRTCGAIPVSEPAPPACLRSFDRLTGEDFAEVVDRTIDTRRRTRLCDSCAIPPPPSPALGAGIHPYTPPHPLPRTCTQPPARPPARPTVHKPPNHQRKNSFFAPPPPSTVFALPPFN